MVYKAVQILHQHKPHVKHKPFIFLSICLNVYPLCYYDYSACAGLLLTTNYSNKDAVGSVTLLTIWSVVFILNGGNVPHCMHYACLFCTSDVPWLAHISPINSWKSIKKHWNGETRTQPAESTENCCFYLFRSGLWCQYIIWSHLPKAICMCIGITYRDHYWCSYCC